MFLLCSVSFKSKKRRNLIEMRLKLFYNFDEFHDNANQFFLVHFSSEVASWWGRHRFRQTEGSRQTRLKCGIHNTQNHALLETPNKLRLENPRIPSFNFCSCFFESFQIFCWLFYGWHFHNVWIPRRIMIIYYDLWLFHLLFGFNRSYILMWIQRNEVGVN